MRCLIVDDDDIQRKVVKNFVSELDFLKLMGECANGIEASNFLKKEKVDLIFLDVEMPGMSGLEFVRTLKNKPEIVLITSHEKFAVEAFEVDISDYIVKPIEYARFLQAVNKVKERFDAGKEVSGTDSTLFIKEGLDLVRINMDDIIMVAAEGDYVKIVTSTKNHMIKATMQKIEDNLPANKFMRVHRSYIVKLDQVNRISQDVIDIHDKSIPISKSYKDAFLGKLQRV